MTPATLAAVSNKHCRCVGMAEQRYPANRQKDLAPFTQICSDKLEFYSEKLVFLALSLKFSLKHKSLSARLFMNKTF